MTRGKFLQKTKHVSSANQSEVSVATRSPEGLPKTSFQWPDSFDLYLQIRVNWEQWLLTVGPEATHG